MLLLERVIIRSQIIPVKNAHRYNEFAIKVIKHMSACLVKVCMELIPNLS